jgi:hypothetical protein
MAAFLRCAVIWHQLNGIALRAMKFSARSTQKFKVRLGVLGQNQV